MVTTCTNSCGDNTVLFVCMILTSGVSSGQIKHTDKETSNKRTCFLDVRPYLLVVEHTPNVDEWTHHVGHRVPRASDSVDNMHVGDLSTSKPSA